MSVVRAFRPPILAALVISLTSSQALAALLVRVPADAATLTTAISQVVDGGIIEIANGTYSAPSGGFQIFNNSAKTFTIRAAPGATVVLSGGGTKDILRFQNGGANKPVVFEGLTFSSGRSSTPGIGGAVTLANARATFVDCSFVQNTSTTSTNGGGAISIQGGSVAFFHRTTWTGNRAAYGGGAMLVYEDSTVYLHEAEFVDNHTNLSGHISNSFGGAIAIVDAKVRISQSRFEANGAGFSGGAISALGSWIDPVSNPTTDLVIANSTFTGNQAKPAVGVTPPGPNEGGAIHVEDQTLARIYHSRFEGNSAQAGGALSCYRCELDVHSSLFRGNAALGSGAGEGNGGTFFVHSDDAKDPSTNNGAINRRPAELAIHDTLIAGGYAGGAAEGRLGGCVFVGGDSARAYGLNGMTPQGGIAANRTPASFDHVVFSDCDALGDASQGGTGGAMAASLVDLTISDSLVIDSAASATGGGGGSGGGLALYSDTTASIDDSLVAHNSALTGGGGIWVSGAHVDLNHTDVVENSLTSGNQGSGLFFAPDTGGGLTPAKDVSGVVSSCVISNNSGPSAYAILELDSTTGPINSVQYTGNTIHPDNTFTFLNGISGPKNVAGLNALVVNRSNGTSTDKAPSNDNTAPASAPIVGGLWAVPDTRLPGGARGDAIGPTESDLAYGWSGVVQSDLDGQSRTGYSGIEVASSSGAHAFGVSGQSFPATILDGVLPGTTLSGPATVGASGASVSLSWSTVSGTLVDEAIDRKVSVPSPATPSGSVAVTPVVSTTYRGFLVAEEGGDVDQAIVDVVGGTDRVFVEGFEGGSLAGWPVAVTDGGDLFADPTSAMVRGSSFGMTANVDDTAPLYVEDTSPAGEKRFRVRFYVDPNGIDPGESAGAHRIRLVIAEDAVAERAFVVVLKRNEGAFSVLARAKQDDGSRADSDIIDVSDGPHWVEVHWRAATSPAVHDGILELWIDGESRSLVSGIDNDGETIESVRFGAMSVKSGASGVLRFDDFEARRFHYMDSAP